VAVFLYFRIGQTQADARNFPTRTRARSVLLGDAEDKRWCHDRQAA